MKRETNQGVRSQKSVVRNDSSRICVSAASRTLLLLQEAWWGERRGGYNLKFANFARLAALLLGILVASQAAFGQVATGIPPFSSASASAFDTVDNANLNVMFAIPILNKAGRGLPFNASLIYNSSVWIPASSGGSPVWTPITTSNWGWTVYPTGAGTVSFQTVNQFCMGSLGKEEWDKYYSFVYTDNAGTQHPFNLAVSDWSLWGYDCGSGAPSTTGSGIATDGSGFTLSVQATLNYYPITLTGLRDRSGNSYGASVQGSSGTSPGTGTVTDPNGNQLTKDTNGHFYDTLSTSTAVLTVAGSGTQSSPTTYTYTGPNGSATYTVNYTQKTVKTNFGCSGVSEYGATPVNLVSSIGLPDGTSYTFTYEPTQGYSTDVTGRLASVVLPTGGTISYSYGSGGTNEINCADGSALSLSRSTPDTGASPWVYSHDLDSNYTQTFVGTPDGGRITYYFSGVLETERTVQDQYLNTLEDVVTCYNSNTSSCNTTAVTLPITQITATTTLGSVKSQNNTNINSYGLPTEVDQYGYGSGSPGGLIRKILTTYNTSLTNIYDRASVVQTKDNGGTIQAHRTYSYNSTGNLTGESIYTVGSTTVSRTLTPNTYGVLTASTDFNSHSTTYGGFTCGGSTAFPTTITTGSLTTTLGWSCDGGVVTSVQDANGKTTSINYNTTTNHNNFWGRVVEVDYPDGGVNTTTYTDTTGAFNVVNSALVRSGVSHQTTQLLDSLGRVYQAQDNSAASYVDTTYDSLGRVASVSNPYYSVSDPSYGVTSYSYDPLNRLSDEGTTKAITRPDGNKVSMTYSSNSASLSFCSTVGDEAGKVRTICTDALGRTTSVTEDPSPGLNYQTTYAYDVMNNLTGVAQGSQTRTYVYDMASRITQATTPESGTTTYTYPVTGAMCSGNLSAVCTRTDARNITTTYAYDTLNRLTGKSYSDNPPTPPATFNYDQTSVTIGSWSSGTLTNPKGRLTEAVTTSGGNVQTALVYSYDSMGRPVGDWQCTTYNCGSASIWNMPFSYDLAGDITAWTHPAGFTITNTLSAAQRITQISSSLVDSTHPANMAQNITYTAWGALSTLQNGCAGSGCTNTQETYNYNSRLQPARIELGTSGTPPADYCQVYNYYAGASNPTSCAVPSPSSTGNNGNVMGYLYQDSVNSSLGHTATFTYDTLNRLTSGIATGSSTYNLTYGYSQDGSGRYGNMSCVLNGQTNGLCPQYTFSATNNRITGYSYDNAGNVTADGTYGYTWDAEERLTSTTGSGVTETNTYNALGQLASYNGSTYNSSMVFDPAGQWVGEYNQTGGYWWPEYIRLGGRVVAFNSQGTNNTVFLHKDLENTTRMVTGPSGSLIQDHVLSVGPVLA